MVTSFYYYDYYRKPFNRKPFNRKNHGSTKSRSRQHHTKNANIILMLFEVLLVMLQSLDQLVVP